MRVIQWTDKSSAAKLSQLDCWPVLDRIRKEITDVVTRATSVSRHTILNLECWLSIQPLTRQISYSVRLVLGSKIIHRPWTLLHNFHHKYTPAFGVPDSGIIENPMILPFLRSFPPIRSVLDSNWNGKQRKRYPQQYVLVFTLFTITKSLFPISYVTAWRDLVFEPAMKKP